MPDEYQTMHAKLVNHLIWLESLDPVYAVYALTVIRQTPSNPWPNILADVKAEKARRALASPAPVNQPSKP